MLPNQIKSENQVVARDIQIWYLHSGKPHKTQKRKVRNEMLDADFIFFY